jgi:seryl-tRNA synthetase
MDYGFIEKQRQRVEQSLTLRKDDFDLAQVDQLNQARKDLQTQHDQQKAKLNDLSKQIGQIYQQKGSPEEAQLLKAQSADLKSEIQSLHEALTQAEDELTEKLFYMPNVLDASVGEGQSEQDNQEIRQWGEPATMDHPQDHEDLALGLGILNIEQSAKVSGSRFSYLVGDGARLERALVNFMLDVHHGHGYQEISSPLLVHPDAMKGTGQLPKFADDAFFIEDGNFYLIPTAEVPVTNYHRQQVMAAEDLPQTYVCYSPCFRKEAGSYGKDTKGLIRQHQFHKVELVAFVEPQDSYQALETLTSHAETILQQLELPYRVMNLCAGDIGFSAAKTYDLEVWLPSQQTYREISSCSNFEDFQARRAGIKYRKDGKNHFVHTLNGSGLAIGRTLVAILENYQQPDGSVEVPRVLQPYLKKEKLTRA